MDSVLRYPGSKRFLLNYLKKWITDNNLENYSICEPFCGSAILSLSLLRMNIVRKIYLYDKDPIIYALWEVILTDPVWLKQKIDSTAITMDEWNIQHSITPKTLHEQAWKCLFLNRTCFSGILKAGPLGGKDQNSINKLDCRFNKERIKSIIDEIHAMADRIHLLQVHDWKDAINRVSARKCIVYCDPPYVVKGRELYRHFFNEDDHRKVFSRLNRLNVTKNPWLLSYDNCPLIENLCNMYNLTPTPVSMTSTCGTKRLKQTELVIHAKAVITETQLELRF